MHRHLVGRGRDAAERPTVLARAPQQNRLAQTSGALKRRAPGLRRRGPFCLSGELAVAQVVLPARQAGLLLPWGLLESQHRIRMRRWTRKSLL